MQHAGLKELFEGRGEHEQITFFGVTNLSILNYMLQNGYKRVIDIPVEDCKNILCKLIVPKRLMVNDIPRGQIIANTGEKVDGIGNTDIKGICIYVDSPGTLYANRGSGRSFIVYQD